MSTVASHIDVDERLNSRIVPTLTDSVLASDASL